MKYKDLLKQKSFTIQQTEQKAEVKSREVELLKDGLRDLKSTHQSLSEKYSLSTSQLQSEIISLQAQVKFQAQLLNDKQS